MHLDVFALIALREVGNGGNRRWLGPNRRLALLDSGNDRSGVLAGCLRSERGIPADRYAVRPTERPGLDDEDLLAGRIDSDAESCKIAVPEDGILAIDGQAVHDTFGESAELGLRHGAVLREADPAGFDRFRCRKRLGSARGSQMGSKCG